MARACPSCFTMPRSSLILAFIFFIYIYYYPAQESTPGDVKYGITRYDTMRYDTIDTNGSGGGVLFYKSILFFLSFLFFFFLLAEGTCMQHY